MASEWERTGHAGLFVRHDKACARRAGGRKCTCRGGPSYRANFRDPRTGKSTWTRSTKNRNEALAALAQGGMTSAAAEVLQEELTRGPTLRELWGEWYPGAASGKIARRKGRKGVRYAESTLAGYERSWRHVIEPEFGDRHADEIGEEEWQAWVDRLSLHDGLSRSRVANHLAVVSALYAWAAYPTRRRVARNPIRLIELPSADSKERLRVADEDEAERLLATLSPDDRVPFAIAFYSGLRRAEIAHLMWDDVDWEGLSIRVRKSKSDAGTLRRPPIPKTLRSLLREAWMRDGQPSDGPVVKVSVTSFRLARRADTAWSAAGLTRITLHECRHTYATWLMASGHTLKELMEHMGHADLGATARYVKLLPLPENERRGDKLNAWLDARCEPSAVADK